MVLDKYGNMSQTKMKTITISHGNGHRPWPSKEMEIVTDRYDHRIIWNWSLVTDTYENGHRQIWRCSHTGWKCSKIDMEMVTYRYGNHLR